MVRGDDESIGGDDRSRPSAARGWRFALRSEHARRQLHAGRKHARIDAGRLRGPRIRLRVDGDDARRERARRGAECARQAVGVAARGALACIERCGCVRDAFGRRRRGEHRRGEQEHARRDDGGAVSDAGGANRMCVSAVHGSSVSCVKPTAHAPGALISVGLTVRDVREPAVPDLRRRFMAERRALAPVLTKPRIEGSPLSRNFSIQFSLSVDLFPLPV